VRPELNFQVQISGPTFFDPRATLFGKVNMLPLTHTFGNLYIECPLLQLRPVVRTQLPLLQRQNSGSATIGVIEIDQNPGASVLTTSMGLTPRLASGTSAEQALEDIAELPGIHTGKSTTMELEALISIRRRTKLLPGLPVGAELVAGNTNFGILEHLVGLTDLLEPRLGIRFLAHIRMVFARRLAIGALDNLGGASRLTPMIP
jgi:hypothetical protein